MIKMNVGIIGGSSGLGKTIVYYLRDDFDVFISGRDHKKGREVASEADVNYLESNEELANISDILIISVPIQNTEDVIREVAPFMKEGSPRTTRLDNQVIVLTPDRKGKWYERVYNYLDSKNMRIIETTAEKHDYMMSIVQVLTHFSFISTASTIEKLKVDLSETEDYESPIYNLMIDLIARIVAQNPYLTYNIQAMNENGPKIRNTFTEATLELRDVINSGDSEKFVEIANKATKHMGDIKNALGRSDKAIAALNYEYTYLNKLIGHEVGLKHIYSGKIHIGILESVDGKTAVLKNGNKTKKLRIANIRILINNELYDWKVKNLDKKTESISCVFPKNVNSKVIEDTVLNMDNIIEIKLIDTYNGPQIDDDHISLTFTVTALYKEDIEKVRTLFTGFGGNIR